MAFWENTVVFLENSAVLEVFGVSTFVFVQVVFRAIRVEFVVNTVVYSGKYGGTFLFIFYLAVFFANTVIFWPNTVVFGSNTVTLGASILVFGAHMVVFEANVLV